MKTASLVIDFFLSDFDDISFKKHSCNKCFFKNAWLYASQMRVCNTHTHARARNSNQNIRQDRKCFTSFRLWLTTNNHTKPINLNKPFDWRESLCQWNQSPRTRSRTIAKTCYILSLQKVEKRWNPPLTNEQTETKWLRLTMENGTPVGSQSLSLCPGVLTSFDLTTVSQLSRSLPCTIVQATTSALYSYGSVLFAKLSPNLLLVYSAKEFLLFFRMHFSFVWCMHVARERRCRP